jgi:apolipoprotein D and lipocalin family protein
MKKLIALALLLTACVDMPVGNKAVPEPLKSVELSRYLGRWYEIGRYENRFEKGCEGVTADYSLNDDGTIKVINTCRGESVKSVTGKAKVVSGAKLKVSFFGPFYGDYHVLDRADDYSWAVVGEPSGKYLWLLARRSDASFEMLSSKAKALGYDTTMLYKVKH